MQEGAEGALSVQQVTRLSLVILTGGDLLQNGIGRSRQRVDVAVQRMVVPVKDLEPLLKSRVQGDELREVVVIFDLMMPVQLVQEHRRVMLHLAPVARICAIQPLFRSFDQQVVQLAKHPVPFQPEGCEVVEVRVPPPFGSRIKIGEHTQMFGQALAGVEKGDVLGVARVAGVMAAKSTAQLIPLCHPLPLDQVTVDFNLDSGESRVDIQATAKTSARTGVEMEAMTAVSIAALAIYDMCKAVDRGMRIDGVRLVKKTGGKSGDLVLEE